MKKITIELTKEQAEKVLRDSKDGLEACTRNLAKDVADDIETVDHSITYYSKQIKRHQSIIEQIREQL